MFNAFETYKAGMIFHNSNGEDYLILKVNKEKDRWLLAKLNSEYFVVAWGLQEHSWCQGHYFMEDLQKALAYVNET